MTLIATVNGRGSIWLLADRRLSFMNRPPKDDARKVMFLETTDGVAILGYTGLGATALGNEPADWMSAVLRGRNLPLEQSLGTIADAMKRQLPRHVVRLPQPAHSVLTTAFLGGEVRFYTIDLTFAPDRSSYRFRYTRHVNTKGKTPTVGIGGSGTTHLLKDTRWARPLLRLVTAYERKKVSPRTVADYLAGLNSSVHAADPLVGPRCIVAWRNSKESAYKGGGGHQFYSGITREDGTSLPTIGTGTDIQALVGVMMPHMLKAFKDSAAGEPPKELDVDQINADLARLPDTPDEDLR